MDKMFNSTLSVEAPGPGAYDSKVLKEKTP